MYICIKVLSLKGFVAKPANCAPDFPGLLLLSYRVWILSWCITTIQDPLPAFLEAGYVCDAQSLPMK